jgi:hypothetical protein
VPVALVRAAEKSNKVAAEFLVHNFPAAQPYYAIKILIKNNDKESVEFLVNVVFPNANEALVVAVHHTEDVVVAKYLINNFSADVNKALVIIAKKKSYAAKFLIDKLNADVNKAIEIAINKNDLDAVKELEKYKAVVNQELEIASQKGEDVDVDDLRSFIPKIAGTEIKIMKGAPSDTKDNSKQHCQNIKYESNNSAGNNASLRDRTKDHKEELKRSSPTNTSNIDEDSDKDT